MDQSDEDGGFQWAHLEQGSGGFQILERFGRRQLLPRVQLASRLLQRGGHLDVDLTQEDVAREIRHEGVQRAVSPGRRHGQNTNPLNQQTDASFRSFDLVFSLLLLSSLFNHFRSFFCQICSCLSRQHAVKLGAPTFGASATC